MNTIPKTHRTVTGGHKNTADKGQITADNRNEGNVDITVCRLGPLRHVTHTQTKKYQPRRYQPSQYVFRPAITNNIFLRQMITGQIAGLHDISLASDSFDYYRVNRYENIRLRIEYVIDC